MGVVVLSLLDEGVDGAAAAAVVLLVDVDLELSGPRRDEAVMAVAGGEGGSCCGCGCCCGCCWG